MVVVLVFFTCNALPFIVNLMELFDFSYKPLTEISNLLVTLNSSCNIFIYSIFGEKFQRELCKYVKRCALFRRFCGKCVPKGSRGQDGEFYASKSVCYGDRMAANGGGRRKWRSEIVNSANVANRGGSGRQSCVPLLSTTANERRGNSTTCTVAVETTRGGCSGLAEAAV